MIVIDTSVLLAGLLHIDVHFSETQSLLDRVRLGQLHLDVPAHFPAEVAGVLARIGESEQLIDHTIQLIELGDSFTIHPISVRLGLFATAIARDARIRGSDAVFLALASALDLPLVTWDNQQRERGARFCRTMTPVEAMEVHQ